MAGTAVIVDATGRFQIGFVAVAGIRLVLVIVMAEVLGGAPRLMLAIDARCCPAELERQKTHQENGEKAAHVQILPDESEMAGEMQRRSAISSIPAVCPQNASGSNRGIYIIGLMLSST
jgi:hypothetical protein